MLKNSEARLDKRERRRHTSPTSVVSPSVTGCPLLTPELAVPLQRIPLIRTDFEPQFGISTQPHGDRVQYSNHLKDCTANNFYKDSNVSTTEKCFPSYCRTIHASAPPTTAEGG